MGVCVATARATAPRAVGPGAEIVERWERAQGLTDEVLAAKAERARERLLCVGVPKVSPISRRPVRCPGGSHRLPSGALAVVSPTPRGRANLQVGLV